MTYAAKPLSYFPKLISRYFIYFFFFFTADPYDTIELLRKQLDEKEKVITSKDKLLVKKEKEIAELKECEAALKRLFNEDQIRLLKQILCLSQYRSMLSLD